MKSGERIWRTVPFGAEREWCVEGVAVVQARATYPVPEGDGAFARRLGHIYRRQSAALFRRCEKTLVAQLRHRAEAAMAESHPLPLATVELIGQTTLEIPGRVWSVCTEVTVKGDGPLRRWRRGDTWDLARGTALDLGAFFPPGTPLRKTVTAAAIAEIERQDPIWTAQYVPQWKRRLYRGFSRWNFTVTPEGLVCFWPEQVLMPKECGVWSVTLPFGFSGCALPGDVP